MTDTTKIRNIVLLGHGSDGKTTIAEAMLFNAGIIDRMGKVDDGGTVCDFDPEETKRHISIGLAVAPYDWKGVKINIIDVPGYFDFIGESAGAMRVADGAAILVSGVSGLVVGAEKAWSMCEANRTPRIFIINQMDRENANFTKVSNQLKDKYGTRIVPLQYPIMAGGSFKGYVDVLTMKAFEYGAKGAMKEMAMPDDAKSAAQALRDVAMESAASGTDTLMEKYFDSGELTDEEFAQGVAACVMDGSIVPVLCAAAAPNLGVSAVMDFMATMMPSPILRPVSTGKNPKNDQEIKRDLSAQGPFSAQVFKTVADPFVGKLSLFKVLSGSMTSDMSVYNPNVDKTEKFGTLYIIRGKKLVNADKLVAGDIGAIAKLQYTVTGHTLCDATNPIVYPVISFPIPQISLAVTAKNQGEEDKVYGGLTRLLEEDPAFSLAKQVETNDMLISGQGELHLEVLCAKLKHKFGVEAVLGNPKIPYRETIRKTVKAEGKHKKQSGGHGQYGHCWVEFSPTGDGSPELVFEDKVVGGVVPRSFIPAVEKGLRECVVKGVLAGCPVVGLKATLFDGSYHAVDSSEMAFKTAARLAFKKGCADANPALLEPIYRIEVRIPDEYMGDIIGDMNRRRGRVMGMNQVEDGQEVVAEVPLAEVFKYATDLRSMTQARGSFRLFFERYEEVPANIAQKVIENAKKEEDEEE